MKNTIPSYEKEYKAGIYLADGLRGQEEGKISMIQIFDSEADRNLYYNADGSSTEMGQAIRQKLESVNAGLAKLGTWTSNYTDWSVR